MNKSQDATRLEEFKNILEKSLNGEHDGIPELINKIAIKLDNPNILAQFFDDYHTNLLEIFNYAYKAGIIDKSEKEELKSWLESVLDESQSGHGR